MNKTRKVVINACFGGFGLSPEAERRLVGCPHSKLMEPAEYYGNRKGWEEKFAHDQQSDFLGVTVHDGKIVIDDHREEDRACPRLIAVVEEMGEAASGRCARLRIVEIPADVEYSIEEYDGNEHIAEVHHNLGVVA